MIALADGGAIVVNGGSHIVLDREDERVAAPKPARGQPPEPIKPVGGVKAGGQKAPSEMSFEEYKAWREGS